MKKKIILFFILATILLPTERLNANQISDVELSTSVNDVQYLENLEVPIKVQFNNLSLYNETLFLSYHIYSKDGDISVSYENTRYPIILDANGFMDTVISIDLSKIKYNDMVEIQFDIVDEKNIYWFMTKDSIVFKTVTIDYKKNIFKNIESTLINAISSNPFIFSINLICSIGTLSVYYIIRKKEIF